MNLHMKVHMKYYLLCKLEALEEGVQIIYVQVFYRILQTNPSVACKSDTILCSGLHAISEKYLVEFLRRQLRICMELIILKKRRFKVQKQK